MSTSSCSTSAAPRVVAAGDDVEHALGQELRGDLGQPQRAQRRGRSGLEDDRVAGRQRRADLPDGHHHRVVPRRDLADDADGLAADHRGVALEVLAGRLALHAARGAGEEAQVVDHGRDLVALEGLDRLAGVGRLELGDLVGALLERVGQLEDRQRALAGRARAPAASKAARAALTARSTSSCVELGAWAISSPVAGLRTASVRALGGVDRLAVDEVLEGLGGGGHRRRSPSRGPLRNVAPAVRRVGRISRAAVRRAGGPTAGSPRPCRRRAARRRRDRARRARARAAGAAGPSTCRARPGRAPAARAPRAEAVALGVRLQQPVLLGDELLDVVGDARVVHGLSVPLDEVRIERHPAVDEDRGADDVAGLLGRHPGDRLATSETSPQRPSGISASTLRRSSGRRGRAR